MMRAHAEAGVVLGDDHLVVARRKSAREQLAHFAVDLGDRPHQLQHRLGRARRRLAEILVGVDGIAERAQGVEYLAVSLFERLFRLPLFATKFGQVHGHWMLRGTVTLRAIYNKFKDGAVTRSRNS